MDAQLLKLIEMNRGEAIPTFLASQLYKFRHYKKFL
jgi:hypothetical protein